MNARMRRLASDWEQIQKDFAGHKNIIVTAEGTEPPEKYHVTYFVNGIYLLPDGRIETLGRHEVEITLHADYPRYKPICKILTPIWHPNFRDGQICIGDIWGAGESLTDIIINIGDMIQYKSWNSSSPLSADAADWALQNKHLFPVGTIDLYIADKGSENNVEIDLLDEPAPEVDSDATELPKVDLNKKVEEKSDGNDFEITAEELEGVEFIPTVQRMQSSASPNGTVKGKINIKTVITKGILWALMGAVVGFGMSEITDGLYSTRNIAKMGGNTHLAEYYDYQEEIEDKLSDVTDEYHQYCEEKGYDKDDTEHLMDWYNEEASDSAKNQLDEYIEISEKADSALYDSYKYEFSSSEKKLKEGIAKTVRTHSAIWSAIIALFVGLFLGIGEGVFYGSKEKALKYGAIGAGVSVLLGYASGYLAQWMYSSMLGDDPAPIAAALVRGIGWAVMGVGIGLAVGLIKPELKRLLFCVIGGTCGAFLGGFLFNFIGEAVPNDMVSRGVAIVIMGFLIGIGVGLLEQFAKQAWLKVIRGEFEGKEYLVFAGTTSIGNNGKNTIVLFKDKLIGPHHCDIVLEGSRYVVKDCGTPMGTLVNGQKVTRQILKQGDAISIGNSVLVFNTK
ncbi:MAG: FHA domain-containing protein [Ruminococcus sp.]|nr:FHA domain-containing protein [Ruminococcus sp.]